ncbi:MAG TPA: hypothetical protein ENL03_00185, partial [Phycisphaerae bacterium]|nr:hypothetical protein [Phycisphaerae bacterium]
MAMLTEGTMARQIALVGRWLWASIVIVGMLTWWAPGYTVWGALMGAMGVVLLLWLMSRMMLGNSLLPGHWFHTAMLVPVVIVSLHVAFTGLGKGSVGQNQLFGAVNISVLVLFALISCGVMLSQSLLPAATRHFGVLSLCGGAMVGGALMSICIGSTDVSNTSLSLLGFAGIAVWLCVFWGGDDEHLVRVISHRVMAILSWSALFLAVAAAVALAVLSPTGGVITSAIIAIVLLVVGLSISKRRLAGLIMSIVFG